MGENAQVSEPPGGRWLLVILGMIINLCLGSIYSWSVFKAPLQAYLEGMGQTITASDLQLPFMIFLAVFSIFMVLSGKYIEIYGPRKVAMVGGILCGLGWLSASTANSIPMLTVLYGVIGGAGVGIAYGVPVAVSGRWFPDKRGLAVGLTVLGFGFSALLTANIAGYLNAAYGVMNTFRIFGIAFIIIIFLLAMPLTFPPPGYKPAGWTPPAPKPGAAVSCEVKREEMIHSKVFYGLWLCYFIGCLAGLMAISISADVAKQAVNIEAGLATMLVGFFAIFNGGGRPVFGTLTDKLNPRNTAMLSFILIAVASLLIYMIQTVSIYILSFAILWGCLGGWLAIAPTSTATFFGTGDYPRCYGVVFLAYGAGALVGPLLAGYVKDTTGSFINVFPLVILLAAIGFVVAFLLMRPPDMSSKA